MKSYDPKYVLYSDGDEMETLKDLSTLMKAGNPENVFQTTNYTKVVGNVGNSVTLPCTVHMELKFGVVIIFIFRSPRSG